MATSCRPSPTRARLPVLGSTTPAALKGAITWGAVQVAPPSVDLTNASWALLATPRNGVLGGTIRSVKSYRASVLGSTTMMLPIVCCRLPEPMIVFTGLQVTPPSVVFENSAGPVYAAAWMRAAGWSVGAIKVSHTVYAVPAWIGSAVVAFLSVENCKFG